MSNKQITAVNWLVEQLRMQTPLYTKEQIIEIAKEMEKQDIIDAWYDGVHNWDNEKTPQEYYTETYGGKKTMSNKKETPVEWLVEQVKSKEYTNDMYSWQKAEVFIKALKMEDLKQQKYDEMLGMLEYFVNNNMLSIAGEEMAEQLIKEAKEL